MRYLVGASRHQWVSGYHGHFYSPQVRKSTIGIESKLFGGLWLSEPSEDLNALS